MVKKICLTQNESSQKNSPFGGGRGRKSSQNNSPFGGG